MRNQRHRLWTAAVLIRSFWGGCLRIRAKESTGRPTFALLKVFPNLSRASAWQVVFDGATHMSFGDRNLRGKSDVGNRYHNAILALTTAFWDAHLKGDSAAKKWLDGDGAERLLAKEDVWEKNRKYRSSQAVGAIRLGRP